MEEDSDELSEETDVDKEIEDSLLSEEDETLDEDGDPHPTSPKERVRRAKINFLFVFIWLIIILLSKLNI